MIVLGIDPGYGRIGYGVIEYIKNKYKVIEYGSITTPANSDFSKRLLKIYNDLTDITKRYSIDAMAIEELFFNTNTKTAIDVAQARGVLLLTAELNGITSYGYTPLQVKQALVGYGRADKKQIQEMVKSFLNLDNLPKLDDTTDALAIAITHIHSYRFNELT